MYLTGERIGYTCKCMVMYRSCVGTRLPWPLSTLSLEVAFSLSSNPFHSISFNMTGVSSSSSAGTNAPQLGVNQYVSSVGKGKGDDGGGGVLSSLFSRHNTTTASIIFSGVPNLTTLCIQSVAIATITLYVLNQKHMLPLPLGRVVSKALFWPTIPITISKRIGKWTTVVDNAVVIGGAPFGWCGYPEKLSKQFNVKGVVNMCDEYRGPVSSYERLGIENLHLPTVDHFEPSVEDLKRAVSFIQKHESRGGRVYVHCRAGHGRSAAAVYAWLLYKEPLADPVELNEKLCSMRDVRKTLWKQPNINVYRLWLQNGGMSDSDSEDEDSSWWSRQQQRQEEEMRQSAKSDAEESEDIIQTKLGQVFSDEESSIEDEYYDAEYYDE